MILKRKNANVKFLVRLKVADLKVNKYFLKST